MFKACNAEAPSERRKGRPFATSARFKLIDWSEQVPPGTRMWVSMRFRCTIAVRLAVIGAAISAIIIIQDELMYAI